MKIKITIAIVSLLIFSGCSKEKVYDTRKMIQKDSLEKASQFILTCAKNANPLSDEEGEDLVKQCEKTAMFLYGKVVKGHCYVIRNHCWDNEFIVDDK